MRRGSLSPAGLIVVLSLWGPLSSACGNGDSSLHDIGGDASGGSDAPADTIASGDGPTDASDGGRDAPADVRTFDAHEDVVLPDVVQPPEDAPPGDAGDQDATHMMPADGGFID